ncbi:hypothetical protein PROFUN_14377 [Planoprotostelium fungivorum]|uniref:Uncharacterized protein n=1 Tax=Planoprotostelium fungivorum TaxID=1890364 RepID=A0A2P6MVV0_9EUKA|nr:hypothetical protein PROFUN_14377 [Planoprotostelium fungivorum]
MPIYSHYVSVIAAISILGGIYCQEVWYQRNYIRIWNKRLAAYKAGNQPKITNAEEKRVSQMMEDIINKDYESRKK